MRHHLFVSYARTPDALLAREVERLLESFHDTMRDVPGASALEPLRICLDGSDFSMPPPDERDPAGADDVLGIVFRHLAQCRELLVLCSTGAARSTWIDREVRWFVEHRGAQFIRVGLTEGDRPWAEPQLYYPDALQELDLPRKIFYDLRGYDRRRSRNWTQVAEFSREMVRLAADLYGKPAGELYPTWLERELSRARTQSLGLVGSSRFETLAGDPGRALLVAFEAHELHPSPETEAALRDAYRVTRLHHENRREAALMTGSGPQHLAGRWKQGQLFSRSGQADHRGLPGVPRRCGGGR